MTVIGVERTAQGLELHSCPSCGRHVWRSGGEHVDRAQLLAALQVERPRAAAPSGRPAAPPADEDTRRTELQRLLHQFTVHGSSS